MIPGGWITVTLICGIILLVILVGYWLWLTVEEETEDSKAAMFARAAAAKRDLDAQAFQAAQAILEAIRRNGGTRE